MKFPDRSKRSRGLVETPLCTEILIALRHALSDEELAAAEHLLCAVETLASAAGDSEGGEQCQIDRDKAYLAIAQWRQSSFKRN